jgi:hypothetical protein
MASTVFLLIRSHGLLDDGLEVGYPVRQVQHGGIKARWEVLGVGAGPLHPPAQDAVHPVAESAEMPLDPLRHLVGLLLPVLQELAA